MKHVLKLSLIIAFLAIYSSLSFSQLCIGFDLGPQKPLITGSNYDPSLGFSVNIGDEKLGIGLRTGFQKFSINNSDYTLTILPIALYFQTYLGKNQENKFKLFYGGEIGGYSYKTEGELMGIDLSSSKMYFGGAAEFGANYDLSEKIAIYSKLKYSYILSKGGSSPIAGINLGIKYKISNKKS